MGVSGYMFGFLLPRDCSLDYRSRYSRMCQIQRQCYGAPSTMFLSYEAIFLYTLLTEAAYESIEIPKQYCCRLRKLSDNNSQIEKNIGKFCASFSLILAKIKIDDDIYDENRLFSRLLKNIFHSKFNDAIRYFEKLRPDFKEEVHDIIELSKDVERQANSDLSTFQEPTATGFELIFSMSSQLGGVWIDKQSLSEIGDRIGRSIIAFDCASDYRIDQRTGNFNPLKCESERVDALLNASNNLRECIKICEAFDQIPLISVSILKDVAEYVEYTAEKMCKGPGDKKVGRKLLSMPNRYSAIGGMTAAVAYSAQAQRAGGEELDVNPLTLCCCAACAYGVLSPCLTGYYYDEDAPGCGPRYRRCACACDHADDDFEQTRTDCCGNPIYRRRGCC